MKRISSIVAFGLFVALVLSIAPGCRAQECQKMSRCCAAIKDHKGVGKACGKMTQGLKDPQECRSVVQAAQAMFKKHGEKVPAACQ